MSKQIFKKLKVNISVLSERKLLLQLNYKAILKIRPRQYNSVYFKTFHLFTYELGSVCIHIFVQFKIFYDT
jgi:hypothetical protein